jgi:hypothetical protein
MENVHVAGIEVLRNGAPNRLSILDSRWLTHGQYDLGGFPPLQPACVLHGLLGFLISYITEVQNLNPAGLRICKPAATPSFF